MFYLCAMGMDLNVHVGPILKVIGKLEKKATYFENICSGKEAAGCPFHRDGGRKVYGNFCSNCGSSVIEIERVETEQVSIYRVIEEMSNVDVDDLYFPEYVGPKNETWGLPNRNYYKYDDENFALMSSDFHIQEDFDSFNGEFKHLIRKLKSVFGEDKIKVDWGIINYYS